MDLRLEELIRNREELLEVLERNDSAAGIQQLLTDLYPDSAHFVYELLQNAEDAAATEVEFVLNDTGVYFAHNGKREFTFEDVDAITAIGANYSKQSDSTSIGEFGVGFKAVFAYTSTPEIHSGQYHFRIRNHFIIDVKNTPQTFIKHAKRDHWTEFNFPFDNPNKPANRAYRETLTGLEKLNETSLLFLRNISAISYSVDKRKDLRGYVRRVEHDDGTVELIRKNADNAEESSAYLRFSKETTVMSSRGKIKTLPIAIAYALERESANRRTIKPIDGKTFIYFPAEKEYSKLKFHINAPFSATVARDSIRQCDDNDLLISQIAELVASSIKHIKEAGLLTTAFYAVMPTVRDDIDATYKPIVAAVQQAFYEGEYLITKSGGFVSARNAVRGPVEYSDLIQGDLMTSFAGLKGQWISDFPRNINRRESDFLDMLKIADFDARRFADAFITNESREALLAKARNALQNGHYTWLKVFYRALLFGFRERQNSSHGYRQTADDRLMTTLNNYVRKLEEVEYVACVDGYLRKPREVFFLTDEYDAENITDPIVEPKLVSDEAKTVRYDSLAVRDMLRSCGVEIYSIKVELKRLVEKYSNIDEASAEAIARDRNYYKDVLNLAKAHRKGYDVPIAGIKMFIGRTSQGKNLYASIEQLALGDTYGIEHGDAIAAFQKVPLLDKIYSKVYSGDDYDCFIEYIKSAGIEIGLKLIECPISNNPKYPQMQARGGKVSSKCVTKDWTIRGLPDSLPDVSWGVAYALWKLLCENGATTKFGLATYQANARSSVETADTQLIYHLKNNAWLPDTLGDMHKPGEIEFNDLDYAFQEIAEGKLIAALDLGSQASKQKLAEKELVSAARKLGQYVVSEEDYQLLLKAKEKERKSAEKQAAKANENLSAQDYLDKQNRETRPAKSNGLRDDFGAVANPERRQQRIAETIKDLEEMPIAKRTRFSVVTTANKQEKKTLEEWYRGRCQICDTVILRHNGEPYFEAINIISTNDLPDRFRNTVSLGWNTLSLCPNCAAKYRYSGKKLSGFQNQVNDAEIVPGDEERIPLNIELGGRTTTILFTPKHFLALREGLRRLDS